MPTLAEALASIPERRNALNTLDDRLAEVIAHVEHVLHTGLRITVPFDITYDTEDGRFILAYGKSNGRWQILWGNEADDDSRDKALLSAPRQHRAAVFVPDEAGQSPMEHLLVEAAESLSHYTGERAPQLEVAERLAGILTRAGFPPPPLK